MAKDVKSNIILAALEVMHADPRASLANIAEQAGVSSMTIHRHFKTKRALCVESCVAVIKNTQALLKSAMKQTDDPTEQLRLFVEDAVVAEPNYHYLTFLAEEFNSPKVNRTYASYVDAIGKLAGRLKRNGAMDKKIPTAWLTELIEGIVGAAYHSLRNGDIAPNVVPKLAGDSIVKAISLNHQDKLN